MLDINALGLALCIFPPMWGGLLYGMDIGITSFVLAMLVNPPAQDNHDVSSMWWSDMSSMQQGLFVSGLSLGALMGSHLVLVYLSRTIGRRMELRLAAILYAASGFLNAMSGQY